MTQFTYGEFTEVKNTEKYVIETATFKLGDEKEYFATYWKPQQVDQPRGLVFISHGINEYICPSYDEVSERLVEEGFLVFGHDHIGHGRSSGQRVQIETLDDYVHPVLCHVKKVSLNYGNSLPLFIIGHSMGGLITAYCTIQEPDLFNAIVLNGPCIKMNPEVATPFKKMLASVFRNILPSFALGGVNPPDITRDQKVVERVKNDPLCWHGGFRTQLSYVLLEATDQLLDGSALKKINSPILILQGQKDKLVDPSGAAFAHDNVSSKEKKVKIYEEGFHNLYVELDDVKLSAIQETCDWISKHV